MCKYEMYSMEYQPKDLEKLSTPSYSVASTLAQLNPYNRFRETTKQHVFVADIAPIFWCRISTRLFPQNIQSSSRLSVIQEETLDELDGRMIADTDVQMEDACADEQRPALLFATIDSSSAMEIDDVLAPRSIGYDHRHAGISELLSDSRWRTYRALEEPSTTSSSFIQEPPQSVVR